MVLYQLKIKNERNTFGAIDFMCSIYIYSLDKGKTKTMPFYSLRRIITFSFKEH